MSHGIMPRFLILSLFFVVKSSIGEQLIEEKPIVCYLTFWGKGKDIQPENVDPSLCSHIIVGFVSVSNNSVQAGQDKLDFFRKIVDFKQMYPNLKVMYSIGGGGRGSGISIATSNNENRKKFVESIMTLIDELDMDGVDIDWEFPAWFSALREKNDFSLLLKDLRIEIDKRERKLLLSTAVAAKTIIIAVSYDAPSIAKYCDFVNLMSYGFHDFKSLEEPFTGYNSPLFSKPNEFIFRTFNLAYAADYWVKIGVPKSKLYVGIPVYTHTYTLAFESLNSVYSLAVDGGQDWSYSQSCQFISDGAIVKFDNYSLVPYAYNKRKWISYENEKSVKHKANWIKSKGYGGVMIFNLNTDDWINACGEEKFPLTKIIKKTFN